ncbi:hypothetical protein F4804DRAFT_315985 [Jackrogersella minutella]|nr:hypothetical protein F4804DRAFT_315985 [Jackrogersella minutella]
MQNTASTAIPAFTSELSDLTSELSDLPNATPNVSASDEDDEPEDESLSGPQRYYSPARVVAETHKFWRSGTRRRRGYTFQRFLEGYLLEQTRKGRPMGSRSRQVVLSLKTPSIRKRLEAAGVRLQFDDDENQEIADVAAVRDELLALMKEPAFGKFKPGSFSPPGGEPCAVKDVCNTLWIDSALQESWDTIEKKAPGLQKFLTGTLTNQRTGRKSYDATKTDGPFKHVGRAYMIIAILLGVYAPVNSNFLPMSIGIYLHASGVPRQVIDTLHRLGVCPAYQVVMSELKGMDTLTRTDSPNSH